MIRIASRFSKRAQVSCFWALKYVGNFIGSNLFEPEPDQNRGPVQSSDICLNRTVGPVHGSQKTSENRTEPNFGITTKEGIRGAGNWPRNQVLFKYTVMTAYTALRQQITWQGDRFRASSRSLSLFFAPWTCR